MIFTTYSLRIKLISSHKPSASWDCTCVVLSDDSPAAASTGEQTSIYAATSVQNYNMCVPQEGVEFAPVKIAKLQGNAVGKIPTPETWRYLMAWQRLPCGSQQVR